jgi:hypothetical protein
MEGRIIMNEVRTKVLIVPVIFAVFLIAFSSHAGDLTVQGNLNVTSNITAQSITGANVPVGATLRVDAVNGNDATAMRGDWNRPYLTVSNAVSNAQVGDRIAVGPGRYIIPPLVLPNSVCFECAGPHVTQLVFTNTFAWAYALTLGRSNIIRNCSILSVTNYGILVFTGGGDAIVQNCHIDAWSAGNDVMGTNTFLGCTFIGGAINAAGEGTVLRYIGCTAIWPKGRFITVIGDDALIGTDDGGETIWVGGMLRSETNVVAAVGSTNGKGAWVTGASIEGRIRNPDDSVVYLGANSYPQGLNIDPGDGVQFMDSQAVLASWNSSTGVVTRAVAFTNAVTFSGPVRLIADNNTNQISIITNNLRVIQGTVTQHVYLAPGPD